MRCALTVVSQLKTLTVAPAPRYRPLLCGEVKAGLVLDLQALRRLQCTPQSQGESICTCYPGDLHYESAVALVEMCASHAAAKSNEQSYKNRFAV